MPENYTPPLDYTALDLEWVSEKGAAICEIGAVRFRQGKPTDTFHSKVRPGTPQSEWNPFSVRVSHADMRELIDAPEWGDIYPDLLDFTGDDILAIHNAPSDISHMVKACEATPDQSDPLEIGHLSLRSFDYVDTCTLDKRVAPGRDEHTLGASCRAWKVDWDKSRHHTADYDALKCGELLAAIASSYAVTDFDQWGYAVALREIVADMYLPDDVRNTVIAAPGASADEWLESLYWTPAEPGDPCRVCGRLLSSKSRKVYRAAHCCTAPCYAELRGLFEGLRGRLDNAEPVVRHSPFMV